jgi:hypothetical protein
MSISYIYFIIFFCVAYLIITDQSVAKGFYMLTQLARVQYEKVKWWVRHSPSNIFVRWLIHRRSMKLAKELMEELAEKNKD